MGLIVRPSPSTSSGRPASASTPNGIVVGRSLALTAITYSAPLRLRLLAATEPSHGTLTVPYPVQSIGASERTCPIVRASCASTPGARSQRFQKAPVQLFVK